MIYTNERLDLAVEDAEAIPHPSEYNLPHNAWRPYQYETVQWITGNSGVMICEQPTGSGKSAVAASQSISRRTISLVRTKYLQKQYGDIYNAHILMGKGNYPCAHPDYPTFFADDCPEENMYQCPYAARCEYLDAKKKAQYLPFVSTNYAYWLSSRTIRENVELLVCDEAHLLSDIVLDWAGMTIPAPVRRKWELPEFPIINSSIDSLETVQGWLGKSILILAGKVEDLSFSGRDEDLKEKKRASEQLMKLASTSKAVSACQQDWFVRSGPGVCYYRGAPVPGLVVRPLTAKYHFPRMLIADYDMLLMSATIGSEETFCGELGIANHWLRRVKNQYAPAERPIYALDVPRLNYKSQYKDYERQADEIARAIKMFPPSWSGFVHITRKTEARKMADRLARRGLGERVWIPPQQDRNGRWLGTGDQAILWNERRDRYPGSLCISWQFWEGMDGLDEKINIIAKVPFPSLGDEYEKARMRYSKSMYSQRAAWTIMQASGRTRRGRPQDYDLDGERRGLVALADGNWTRIKKYISPDFTDAITAL